MFFPSSRFLRLDLKNIVLVDKKVDQLTRAAAVHINYTFYHSLVWQY